MASEPGAMPLHERHPKLNVTTQRLPRNFSKPFASPSGPITPPTEQHEFRQAYLSPWTTSSSDYESPRLRRKPSRSNLARALYEPATGQARVTCTTPALASFPQQELLSTLPPPSTSTPLSYPTPTSPSLASTISTLQSTPNHSPIFPGSPWLHDWLVLDTQGLDRPVATKRKFPSFRTAKRLPRRAAADWYVYAAVIQTEDEVGSFGTQVAESDSDTPGDAYVKSRENAKRGRSVRFAGIADNASSGTEQTTSGEEKETTGGSTYSLSKFKFPTPPGFVTWADTFGHLGEPTPPTSPATLHYRGASFDLVNPHASLLLGKHNIETPGEIDNLLDDYFAERSDMPYDLHTGEMSSTPDGSGNNGSRRGRMLYEDPVSARQTIMRIPSAPVTGSASSAADQDSPLAGRGHASDLPRGATHPTQTNAAYLQAPVHEAQREDSGLSAGMPGDRGSSVYPHSTRSDPFDLYVSDDEDPQYNNLDEMVAAGRDRHYANFLDERDESGEVAVYDEGADAEANASLPDRDTTIGNIIEGYDYSSVPHTPEYDDDQTLTSIPSFPSIEHGRGVPATRESSITAEVNAFHAGRRQPQRYIVSDRFGNPPGLPAPTPPTRAVNQQESPELLTSDQTYGATGELLEMTPATRVQGSSTYPYQPGGNSYVGKGKGKATEEDMDDSHSNKENIPPSDSVMAFAGLPAAWSNVDLPAPVRASLVMDRSLSGNPMARVSSLYTEDDEGAWEDTQASESHPNFDDMPQRQSQVSYADLSDDEGEDGLILPPSLAGQGQPSLQQVRTRDGTATQSQFVNKAHRVLMSRPDEPAHDITRQRVKDLLKANMEQKRIGHVYGGMLGQTPTYDRAQMRRDELELEVLRQNNRSIFKQAADEVAAEEMAKRRPRQRRLYDPHNSFEQVIRKCGLGGDDTRSVASSSRAGLLDEDQRWPQMPGELVYSPTINTFRTAPRNAPPMPPMPGLVPQTWGTVRTECWSPLAVQQPVRVYEPRGRRNMTPSTVRTRNAGDEGYELHTLGRFYGTSRPAMSSQTSLLPIQLASTNEESTTTTRVPGRRLTDQEFMDRQPSWRDYGPWAKTPWRQGLSLPVNGVAQPLLPYHDRRPNARVLREQGEISQRWFCLTALCPVTALLFGLGKFDRKAQAISEGRVEEMSPREKGWALYLAVPLGVIVYAIIGIAAFLGVVLSRV